MKDIPCSHDISFFWNTQYSMLSIAFYEEAGTSRLAFFIPSTDRAWYIDRTLSDSVEEVSACWYGEYGYLIQAEAKGHDRYYLHLYQYTP